MITAETGIKQRYRMTGDYHTHTVYSRKGPYRHGKGQIWENAGRAAQLGISEIAITDHGPGHQFYGIRITDTDRCRKDIEKASEMYPSVKVLLGVEADFCDTPNGLDVSPEDMDRFDIVNAGYHYGVLRGHMIRNFMQWNVGAPSGSTERLRNENTEIAVRALYENRIRILTHPCDKGPFDLRELCKACEDRGTLMEISTRHSHLTVPEIETAAEYDVSFVVSSDAHRPEQVGTFAAGVQRGIQAGLDLSRIVNVKMKKEGIPE